jgi:hypothetical protein
MTSKDRSVLLDKLVGDCIAYSLKPKESLEYIKKEYGVISERTYFGRRKKLLSEESTNAWYSHFCRIGFVELHKKLVNTLEMSLDDSVNRLHEEKQKPKEQRDDYLILKLQKCIRETTYSLAEMSAGSPVMAALMYKIKGRVSGDERFYNYDYSNLNFKNNNKYLPLPDKDEDRDNQENH